jgi:hypothetical protein
MATLVSRVPMFASNPICVYAAILYKVNRWVEAKIPVPGLGTGSREREPVVQPATGGRDDLGSRFCNSRRIIKRNGATRKRW